MTGTTMAQNIRQSRAVLLRTTKVGRKPGPCHYCKKQDWNMGQNLRQNSKGPRTVLLINVVENGKWTRLLWAHRGCYEKAGEPHGPILRRDGARFVRVG